MRDDRDVAADRLAAKALAEGDPTGWFEPLYARAAAGRAVVPWDRDEPNPLLVEWTDRHRVDGAGKRAVVVGCGLGRDAEHVASLGFRTTAFDVSPTAVRGARARFPGSVVDYVVADLLAPPDGWRGAFDLVVESITVQSMPLSVRATAIRNIGRMVAPGGDLLVISVVRADGEHVAGPPWPLTRAEVDSFAYGDLRATHVEQVSGRWRAVFRRGS